MTSSEHALPPLRTLARLATPDAAHGLNRPAHGRGVLLAVSHRKGSRVDRNASGKQRGRNPQPGGMILDHRNVLVVEPDAHAGILIAVLHHHRAAYFEHARGADTGANEVVDHLGIE